MADILTQEYTNGEPESGAVAGKYLTFLLDGQEYGLEITQVREIIGVIEFTAVPQTADFVLGVINLRGKVIPVLDLRLRFGLAFRQPDERTCIIVVETLAESGQAVLTGLLADEVSEVINVSPEDIDPTPSFGVALDTGYILGMAKIDSDVKILLSITRVIKESQLVTGI